MRAMPGSSNPDGGRAELGPGLGHAPCATTPRRSSAADPNSNTIFSVHMYGVFDTAAEVTAYLTAFQQRGAAAGDRRVRQYNHSDGNPDEDTIMSKAEPSGIGYMGWSWSGNGGGVEYLDMVTSFNPTQPDHLGPAHLQRRQRHCGHSRGSQCLQRPNHQPDNGLRQPNGVNDNLVALSLPLRQRFELSSVGHQELLGNLLDHRIVAGWFPG